MICKNCGADIPDVAKFCPKCGATSVDVEQEQTHRVHRTNDVNSKANTQAPDADEQEAEVAAVREEVQKIWSDWEVIDRIGKGSFGKVYKAKRDELGTTFHSAIKIIRIPQSSSEVNSIRSEIGVDEQSTTAYFKGLVDDCVNEIKLMESLKGTANIVSVEDYKVIANEDESAWTIYIRMELLRSFTSYMMNKNFSEDEVVKIGVDICSALEYCAKRNVMHRDIKPENIFISDFGDFKLGDFGIARKLEKSTMGMSKKGSYNYMAPEIYNGGTNYDARSDIYSLGIVLYKLLNNNRFPLVDTNSTQITYQQIQAAFDKRKHGEALPKPKNASSRLASVILTACAFDPAKRFGSASALKAALKNALNGATFSDTDANGTVRIGHNANQKQTVPPQNVQPPTQKKKPITPPPVPQVKLDKVTEKPKEKPAKPKKPKKEKKKMPKWKKVLITIAVVLSGLAVGAGVLVYQWYTSPEQQILRAIDAGDYDKALVILAEDSEAANSDSLIANLKDRIASVKTNFSNGEMEYEVAKMELSTIQKMRLHSLDSDLTDAFDYVERVNESRTHFKTAETFLSSGDYTGAIAQYQMVIEDDTNYETAKSQLAVAVNSYREEILKKAAEFADAKNYPNAITVLQDAFEVLPNDSTLSEQLEIYQKDYTASIKSDALAEAKAAAEKEDYLKAMNTLSAIMPSETSDADLTNAYNTYCDKYVEQVLAAAKADADKEDYLAAMNAISVGLNNASSNDRLTKTHKTYYDKYVAQVIASADEKLAAKDYDGAASVVNIGLKNAANEQQLKDKLNAIDALKPIPLTQLSILNRDKWKWNDGTPKDPFGNDYSGSKNFVIASSEYYTHNTAYIEYRLYGKYSRITGQLAPYTTIGNKAKCFIKIFGDDTLLYTSKEITQKTDAFSFDVNISGVEYIYIELNVDDNYSALILSDVTLWPE